MERPSPRWKWYSMAFSAWLLAAPTDAWARPEQYVDLKYEVDPTLTGCLSATEFRAKVAQRLGYDPYRPNSTPSVRVRVQATDAGIEGVIEWITAEHEQIGERRFVAPVQDCRDMTTTMGFVVAVQVQLMALEPNAEAQRTGPDTEPGSDLVGQSTAVPAHQKREPAEAARAPSKVKTPEPPPETAPKSTNWSAMVGAGPLLGVGLGPDPTVLGRAFVAAQFDGVALELGAETSLQSTAHSSSAGGFRHRLLLATLATCGVYRSFSACGVAKLGRIQVHGIEVDQPASPKGLVAQVGPRLAYALRLEDHVVLLGHMEGLYLLTPWTVDLNHVAVWNMPRLSAVTGIALAARFP